MTILQIVTEQRYEELEPPMRTSRNQRLTEIQLYGRSEQAEWVQASARRNPPGFDGDVVDGE